MIRKLQFISILMIMMFFSTCSVLPETDVETLADNLRLQLKNREFGEIYDDASEFMHMNVSREKFIERANKIIEEMERVDKNINWQDEYVPGKTNDVKNKCCSAYKKLGEDTERITIYITWQEKSNDKPKLFDLRVISHPYAKHRVHLITAGEAVESK